MTRRATGLLMLLALSAATFAAETPGAWLGDLNWPEAQRRIAAAPLVIVPFGAGAKEHGPHLPMSTDAQVMQYLCEQAIENLPVLIAPPVLHGWFPAFRGWPGTEVADPHVFGDYVEAIAQSLIDQGAQRIVFLNTGITRATGLPLAIAARELRVRTGTPTLIVSWDDLETEAVAALTEQSEGGHADEIETSIMLVLDPEHVNMAAAVADIASRTPKDYPGYRPGLFARDPSDPRFSATGQHGDATLATAEKGRQVLEIMTDEWLRALRGFSHEPGRPTPAR